MYVRDERGMKRYLLSEPTGGFCVKVEGNEKSNGRSEAGTPAWIPLGAHNGHWKSGLWKEKEDSTFFPLFRGCDTGVGSGGGMLCLGGASLC